MTPFRPQWIKDIANEAPETPNWQVQSLLPQGTLALISAYPKVGKSTLVSQLTVAVAHGSPFLGRRTRQGGVLYVAAEERNDDVIRRLTGFGARENDSIWLWTETAFDTAPDRDALQKFIPTNDIDLVVIDTLATYLMVQDETDNSGVTLRMKPYLDMAHQTGTTILFVHHERKSKEGNADGTQAIRGGGAILALADLSFQLQKDGGSTRRKLRIVGRYREIPQVLQLDFRDDEYVCLGTPEDASRLLQQQKVIAALPTQAPGLTVDEVVNRTEMKKGAVRAALEDAYGTTVERTGTGKRGNAYRYHRVATATPATAEKELVEV